MTFQEWLSSIFGVIPTLLNWCSVVLNSLMNNYIFKFLIYLVIFFFIIELFILIYDFLVDFIKNKKYMGKNKKTNKEIE